MEQLIEFGKYSGLQINDKSFAVLKRARKGWLQSCLWVLRSKSECDTWGTLLGMPAPNKRMPCLWPK